MRLWTVHEPRNPANAAERADKTVFVKDGFSWPALLIPLPWLLYRRLWLGTLIYLLLAGAIALIGYFLPLTEDAAFVLALVANLYAALEGNDLRRRKLAKLGFIQAGTVLAKTASEAEVIFFSGRAESEEAPRAAPPPAAPRPSAMRSRATDDVIGLFPRPEGPR